MGVLARGDALGGQVAALRLGADAVIANHPAVVQEGEALTVGGGFVALAEEGVKVGHVRVSVVWLGAEAPAGLGRDGKGMLDGFDHITHFAVSGGINCYNIFVLQGFADSRRVEGGAL